MRSLLLLGAAIGYAAAPRIIQKLDQLPRPFLNYWNVESRFYGAYERGASITIFGREFCVEVLKKGGES